LDTAKSARGLGSALIVGTLRHGRSNSFEQFETRWCKLRMTESDADEATRAQLVKAGVQVVLA
jgi:hypothetical protein